MAAAATTTTTAAAPSSPLSHPWEPLATPYADFSEHSSAQIVHTSLAFLNILRKRHPDHFVSHLETNGSSSCDLFGFAAAGHATTTIITGEEEFDLQLCYKPVAQRMESKTNPGRIRDRRVFVKCQYDWDGTAFLLYSLRLETKPWCREYHYFLLCPRAESEVVDGHCKRTDELVIKAGQWTNVLHDEIFVFDEGHWAKDKSLFKAVENSSWDDVVLDQEMKGAIIDDVQGFFDSQTVYEEYQVPWRRGIIFHGVPGNGKTMTIKALMAALRQRDDPVPSLYVKSLNSQQGLHHSIREIFNKARTMAPCLLILEDLDSLIGEKTRTYFLNEVDGLEPNDGILMIASANQIDKLDSSIRDRPSRFDRKYHFKIPNPNERVAYAKYWTKKLERNDRVTLSEAACEVIAKMTDGFSFAYMKELFVATLLAIARGHKLDNLLSAFPSQPGQVSDEGAPSVPAKVDGGDAHAASASTENNSVSTKEDRLAILDALELPEDLSSNIFLRIARHQAKLLLQEMGDGGDATKASKGGEEQKEMTIRGTMRAQPTE